MKKIKLVFIIICLVSLIIPLVFADYEGGKANYLDNRVLAIGPAAFFENGTEVDIEKWINDNIGFRTNMLGIKGYIEYNIFHKSPTNSVTLGKNGFMFYTPEYNIDIAKNTYPLTDDIIKKTVKNLIIINDILNKKNIKFIFTFAPSKVSIYPEYLNMGNYSRTTTPIDVFNNSLKNKVEFINLKDALYNEKNNKFNQLLYFKTDTHWNHFGAYIGYKKIIDKMNSISLFHNTEQYIKVDFITSYRRGEFANMMGGKIVLKPEQYLSTKLINQNAKSLSMPFLSEYSKEKHVNVYTYQNSLKDKKILVIGDSMFGGWNIPQLLAEHFKAYYHIWQHEFDYKLIEELQPDIVLYEIAERYAYSFIKNTDEFVKKYYNPKAEISSHNIPNQINKNQTYSFDITIKNIGEYNLGYDYQTSLEIIKDNNTNSSQKFSLPQDIVIKPNETYTLTIDNITVDENVNNITMKMWEEYNAYISNDINIKVK